MIEIEITMKESPYLVEPSKNPQEALRLAIEKNLFEKFEINKKLVNDYLKSKENIPIWIIEAACKINENYIEVPIQYQYIWFCLNKTKVKRETLSGKVWNPIVRFNPVYVKPDKSLLNLVDKCLERYPMSKLGKLCGFKSGWLITLWKRKQDRISLSALLKICQILKKDLWKILENKKIYSKTNYNYIRYKNKLNKRDLLYLLIWVKAEGHISLYKQWIEIKQDEGGINILKDLSKISKKLFKVNEKTIHIRTQKPYQNMRGLRINSAPLRQLLILKYGIDPGYKCQTISLKKEIEMLSNRKDLYFLLAKLIEAEGSFSFSKWKGEKYPKISIITTSKNVLNEITSLLKKEGYPLTVSNDRRKKNVGYTIGIQTINEVIKFCFYILPYFQHKKKIKNFIKEIQKKSFARKIRLNSTKQIIRLIETSRKNNSNKNIELANYLNNKFSILNIKPQTIMNWINGSSPQFYSIYYLCKLKNKKIKDYTPRYFSFLLWSQNIISINELEKVRNETFGCLRSFKNGL